MDREAIKALLGERLAHYRGHRYEQLAALIGSCQVEEVRGIDGTLYQVEVEFFWDSEPAGDIRVIGGIDGGPISTLTPFTDSFIMAPDGSFAGE